MRITWIIVLVAAIVAIYIYIRVSISRLFFKWPTLIDVIGNIKSIQGGTIEVSLPVVIENLNSFDIKFTDLYFELKYKDNLIASSKQRDTTEYTIPAKSVTGNGYKEIKEDTIIHIDGNTISLAGKIISKQTVRIDYSVDLKVFGIKIPTISDYFSLP